MANVKISALPTYTGSPADLRWFVMNNSGETITFKYSGYSSPYKYTNSTFSSNNTYDTNPLPGSYNKIIGGENHSVQGNYNAVVGGYGHNFANIYSSNLFVGGGLSHTFEGGDRTASIGGNGNYFYGGEQNYGVGGQSNQIFVANNSGIIGGESCSVYTGFGTKHNGVYSGAYNKIITDAKDYNTIINGSGNTISGSSYYSTILNGSGNTIGSSYSGVSMLSCFGRTADASNTTYVESIRGFGNFNFGSTNTNTSTNGGVAGGTSNNNTGSNSAIIAGTNNNILGSTDSAIVGSYDSIIRAVGRNGIFASYQGEITQSPNYQSVIMASAYSNITYGNATAIIGGYYNIINGTNNNESIIIGGQSNTLTSTLDGTILNGQNNNISNSNNSQILGGAYNAINCELPNKEKFNTIIGGSGNTIYDAADDQVAQTIINSIDTTLTNGVERVTAIGLSGRSINDATSGTTYVENLKAFRQVASGFYDNGNANSGGITIDIRNGDKQQITITGTGTTSVAYIGNIAGGRVVLKVINTSTGNIGFADNSPHVWRIPATLNPLTPSGTDIYVFDSFGDQSLWLSSHSQNLS